MVQKENAKQHKNELLILMIGVVIFSILNIHFF
jgi:hypothetical protein